MMWLARAFYGHHILDKLEAQKGAELAKWAAASEKILPEACQPETKDVFVVS